MNIVARLVAFVIAAALPIEEAWSKTRDATAAGFTVENSEWVEADPQAAWKALTEDVDKWWPADHTWWGDASKLSIEPRAGGCFCERDADRQAWHMTVALVDPGRLMRMTGGLGPLQGMGLDGTLEWRFVEENGGTRITLWYRVGGYTPDDISEFAPVVDEVQASQLGGLARYLNGDPAEAGADG